MNIRRFFVGRAIGFVVLLGIALLVAGFYALNSYIYKEKQGDVEVVSEAKVLTFAWRFEQAESLNLDGIPETDIFLDITYQGGEVQTRLIDTVPSSCNEVPDAESDSVEGTTNIQCYGAGLGYRFKITKSEESYRVERMMFEEALPAYNPPVYEYETVIEFPIY